MAVAFKSIVKMVSSIKRNVRSVRTFARMALTHHEVISKRFKVFFSGGSTDIMVHE